MLPTIQIFSLRHPLASTARLRRKSRYVQHTRSTPTLALHGRSLSIPYTHYYAATPHKSIIYQSTTSTRCKSNPPPKNMSPHAQCNPTHMMSAIIYSKCAQSSLPCSSPSSAACALRAIAFSILYFPIRVVSTLNWTKGRLTGHVPFRDCTFVSSGLPESTSSRCLFASAGSPIRAYNRASS